MRAAHLASGHHSWLAAEHIQGPGSVLEEAGAGTGHSEEWAQGARPACARVEARVARQGRSLRWEEAGQPGTQAAEWMAAEFAEDPGMMVPTEVREAPG